MTAVAPPGGAFLTFGQLQDALRYALISSGVERPLPTGLPVTGRS